jgi:ribose-phosphate pyrophosphokinase
MIEINLRNGFGDFEDYKLFKFPDNTIKFFYKGDIKNSIKLHIVLRTNDDLIALGIISNTLKDLGFETIICKIYYMMYQQDDRRFGEKESFGLKIISSILNDYPIKSFEVFHPHSDKVEFLNNCKILSNDDFVKFTLETIDSENLNWVIPDSGAFKSQFKQIEKLGWKKFIVCAKSRNPQTGDLEQILNIEDLGGADCVIFDDICLGGRTFIGIANILKKHNCGKLYLAISHGIFNNGTEELFKYFDVIYTTDSICQLPTTDKFKIYKLC